MPPRAIETGPTSVFVPVLTVSFSVVVLVPMPTFSLASIVIAVAVALSSIPTLVKLPDTVRLLYVAVPENVGLEVGAANANAAWIALNSEVNSAPTITLLGSLAGSTSLEPKLVVGV
jgi:hypothetical protein